MIRDRDVIAAAVTAALVAGFSASACSKQPRETTAAQVEPVEVEPPVPPSLFEAIPADTPYLFALIDPWPEELWDRWGEFVGAMQGSLAAATEAALADDTVDPDIRFLLAALDEIADDPTREGLEALGFHPRPEVAFYGLGTLPVARVQIGDADTLHETARRIESRSGFELPTRDVAGHDVWWLSEPGGDALAVAILGDELVVASGPDDAVSVAYEVLVGARELGVEPLGESAIRARAEAEGFSGLGFGYVDIRRLGQISLGRGGGIAAEITALLEGGDPGASDACADTLDRALAHAPMVTFGYSEVSGERVAMDGRLELSDDLAGAVARAETSVPGLTGDFDEPPLFAIGGAVDLQAVLGLLGNLAADVRALGEACGDPDIQRVGRELASSAASPIPPPFSSLRGGMIVLQSIELMMMRAEGYAVVGIDRPAALLRMAAGFVPQLGEIDVPADGEFRPLPEGLTDLVPLDLGLTFALGDDALALAAGDAGRGAAEAAMAAEPDASPLFAMALDYGAFMELVLGEMPRGGDATDQFVRASVEALSSFFGAAQMVVVPDERGLHVRAAIEVRAAE